MAKYQFGIGHLFAVTTAVCIALAVVIYWGGDLAYGIGRWMEHLRRGGSEVVIESPAQWE